jgi:hypothetical protein
LYITVLSLALEFGNALRVPEGQYREQTEKGAQQDMPSSSVGEGFCFHAKELTPEFAILPDRYRKPAIALRCGRFRLDDGQTFNNPTQRWPAIFWSGYTGRGTVPRVAPSK